MPFGFWSRFDMTTDTRGQRANGLNRARRSPRVWPPYPHDPHTAYRPKQPPNPNDDPHTCDFWSMFEPHTHSLVHFACVTPKVKKKLKILVRSFHLLRVFGALQWSRTLIG